ncbi:MAG TPA: nitrogenase molybdenum-iron protein [Candidatus Anaerobutyricum stercoripullorum]|uniref:Nitrogenase molybdenum-iron protein n=1 Tax=Candidatus Anaerobutyricum stercoripullorum TaxID=2838456 RepID=A0A9D1X374_9FIRM|nr:nitrogenase molybdenum-iron protein [Candidatus Anaerobutyricum stercoripullorum]
MKGLRKYISPFAPDQSGATAVFCELGGLVVILDAGGCAGNVCGFDEPRWFDSKSAIFSAGLRDMDAILGRDDKLVEKIGKACKKIDGNFVAVIGTPVPAVIGTDYTALRRMIEKKTGFVAVTVDTNGMELYDDGVRKASLELFRTFTGTDDSASRSETAGTDPLELLGVLGATPMDIVETEAPETIENYYKKKGWQQVSVYGMGAGLDAVRQAGQAKKNLVIAPAGLEAARYLKKKYGTPYEAEYPLAAIPGWDTFWENVMQKERKNVLIVHQQVLANTLRDTIRKESNAKVTVASWFMLDKELKEDGDVHLREEDQWISLVREGGYDLIIGENLFMRAVPDYAGDHINLTHFAVSGKRTI